MRKTRFSIAFILMLVASTLFAGLGFAEAGEAKWTRSNIELEDFPFLKVIALGDSITIGYPEPSETFVDKITGVEDPYKVGEIGGTAMGLKALMIADPILPAAGSMADAVTVNIGSNDFMAITKINTLLQALKQGSANPQLLAGLDLPALIAGLKPLSEQDLLLFTALMGDLLQTTRSQTDAPIVLYNYYNPVNVDALGPDMEPGLTLLHSFVETELAKVNGVVAQLTNPAAGIFLADAYSAFKGNETAFILPMDIHPSPAGHQALASLADAIIKPLYVPELVLEASTVEKTEGPVNVYVSALPLITELKWLAGGKTVVDFSEAGNVMEEPEFSVTENGIYTVYVKNAVGNELVKTIEITNIVTPGTDNPGEEPGDEPGDGPGEEPGDQPVEEPVDTPIDNDDGNVPVPTPVNDGGGSTPESENTGGNPLPATATSIYNYVVFGAILLTAGAGMIVQQRSRRQEG